MTAAPQPRYLLDTSIVLVLARGGDLALWIRHTYPIEAVSVAPLISVVVVGELLSLARQFNWGTRRTRELERLARNFVSLPLETPGVLEAYALIDDLSRRQGRAMNKNDIWIAATAHVTGAVLLTSDRDFDHLHPNFLSREWIDPSSHL